MSDVPVFLTGATGFLGAALGKALLASDRDVHAFARATSDRGQLPDPRVTWHTGDLADKESVTSALGAFRSAVGEGDVIHCGALISYRRLDRDRSRTANVDGTRHVLDACQQHGVRRVLCVSSVVTVGHSLDGAALDESSPFTSADLGVAYVETKRAAEEDALARGELDVVVANPGAIFGRAPDSSNSLRFLRSLANGGLGPFAPPGWLGVVGLADTVDGCLAALDRGRRGERYLLVESSLPCREVFATFARELGVRGPRFTVGRALWSVVVLGSRLVDRVVPLQFSPPEALTMLGCRLMFDASKARTELGWAPRPFVEVARETIRDLRAAGALPVPENGA